MTRLQTHLILPLVCLDEDTHILLEEMGEDVSGEGGTPRPRFGDWRDHVTRCGFAYGHWVRVPMPDVHDPDDGFERHVADMPKCLADCLRHANSFGARYVLFDRDEEAPCGLHRHVWD